MKTKKILAIVTLVAFMISILPMAAFAAAVADTSSVKVVDESAVADGKEAIEVEVYVNDSSWVASNDQIYVVTNRPAVTKIYTDENLTTLYNAAAGITPTAGKAKFYLTSTVPAETLFTVALTNVGTDNQDYVNGKSDAKSAVEIKAIADAKNVTKIPVTFTAASADALSLTNGPAFSGKKANSLDYYEVTYQLKAANGAPISGKEVTISAASSAVKFNDTKKTTDSQGKATFKVFASKSVTGVKLTAKAEGKSNDTATVTFSAAGVYKLALVSDDNQKIAKDEDDFEFKVKYLDANNNKVSAKAEGVVDGLKITATKRPSGVKLKEDIYENTSGAAVGVGAVYTTGLTNGLKQFDATGSDLKIKLDKTYLDKEGDYTIRVSLSNGVTASINFTVKKQGDIVGLKLTYDSSVLPIKSKVVAPEVKRVDAEGITAGVSLPDSAIAFSIDNPKLVNGSIDNQGVFTADDKVGVLNVTVVDTDKNVTGSVAIQIVEPASRLEISSSNNAIGEDNAVTVQLVDINGKPVGLGDASLTSANTNYKVNVLSKPEGAIVSADTSKDVSEDVQESGKFTFDVSSNTAGIVKLQVILDANGTFYVGTADVNFQEFGTALTGDLVMFVGNGTYMVNGKPAVSDAAPFVDNGRTFFAVRPLSDALGCTLTWDEATRTVTMTKPGETVTIVIGAPTLKVDRAGTVTEYPTDVPAQIKDGRTYLPVRAISEAFGYTVTYDELTKSVTIKLAK